MRYISGYNQPQTWLSYIGDWITLVAAVSACSFTFSVFLGWLIQVVPDINNLKSRSNDLEAMVNTTGGPLYFLPNGDPVIGCSSTGFPQDLCTFTSEAIVNITMLQAAAGMNSTIYTAYIHDIPLDMTQEQINAQLTARKSYNMYISATYGNDGTCDATVQLPCATTARTMQLVPNTTSQFAQYNFVYDSGVYTESSPIAIKPNILFSGNEAATYLIFSAGISFDGGAWQATGTGFVSFQHWALIRCTVACNFDMNAAAPATSIFSVVSFYNSTIENLSSVSFRRRADVNSFFKVHFESTVMTLGTATFTDMTLVEWTQSGDIYTNLNINYNTTTTYLAGAPLITVEELISHGALAIYNNVPMSIDVTFTGFVQKDSATLTATAIAGATIATHADVTSYGVINNGLIVSGAGSVTLQYLTQAYGLGYVPYNATNWVVTGVPTNVKQMGDYLDYRVRQLELNTYSNSSVISLTARVTALEATTSLSLYLSAGYGNDATCDGSRQHPCLTLYRTMQLVPNTTNEFFKYTIVFDNGLYTESQHIYFKPNIILSGNEIGTLLILGNGASFDGGAWTSTGTGYVSVLRFALFRCDAACNFDMGAAAPGIGIFGGFLAYNTSIVLNAPMTFARGITGNPFLGVSFESVEVSGSNIFFVDLSTFAWVLSGDSYSNIVVNYTSSTTFNGYVPTVNMNGLINHGTIGVLNYASGLTVDWSIMGVINRDAATLSRYYVSGAAINIHGDILSLGSINGGLLTTGAGSGSTQYLTYDYGLGTAQDTPSDWDTPYPVDQHKTNTQLASRTRQLELTSVRKVTVTFVAGTTSINIPTNVTTVVYISACGGGASGDGTQNSSPHGGIGGSAGAGILDIPMTNRGTNFTITVGVGGASGLTSNSGTDTLIDNGSEFITLQAGQSVGSSNRGGHVYFGSEQIITGSAGGNYGAGLTSPGVIASFNGGVYGGSGGGNVDSTTGYGTRGGNTPFVHIGGVSLTPGSGISSGGGGGSSIFGNGGEGNSAGLSNGFDGELCAGGGGGGTTPAICGFGTCESNGGKGGDGVAYLYYYI